MGGGAWPFLVGGAICLVNSDNERDSSLLNSRDRRGGFQKLVPGHPVSSWLPATNQYLLRGIRAFQAPEIEQ